MADYNESPIKFNFFTRAWDPVAAAFVPDTLKASLGPDQKMRLSGVASSSVKDLHGDIILESALEDMERAANNNMTIFGNHSYQVPEDVYGSTETALLRRNAAIDKVGNAIHMLQLGVLVNDENDRAVKSWKAINKGTKLGLSIGAMIPEGGAKYADKKSQQLLIEHLDLLETSIVGIPANPLSWVDYAVKAFNDSRRNTRYWSLDPSTTVTTSNNSTFQYTPNFPTPDVAAATVWVETRDGDKITIGDPIEESDEATLEFAAAAKCSDCGEPRGSGGGCDSQFHKDVEPDLETSVEPDLEKMRVRVTIDTDEKKPESTSTPEDTAGDTSAESVTQSAALESEPDAGIVTASIEEPASGSETKPELPDLGASFKSILEGLTQRALEAERAKIDALAAQAEAEQRSAAIVAGASDVIAKAKTIIEKLADIPLGPRAAIERDGAAEQLSSLEGVFSREFLEMLRSK